MNNNANSRNNHAGGHIPWKTIFSFAIWNIWKGRNSYVFNGKNPNPKLAMEIVNQAVEFVFCTSSPRGLTHTIIKRVRWERLPGGWVILNTNGAAKGNPGLAGCGGVVRDENDKWIARFPKHIGISTSFVAELWGLREGLILCYDLNVPSLVVELDAKVVVECFLNPNYHNNVISPILDDCKQLVRRFHRIQFRHCYRQAN